MSSDAYIAFPEVRAASPLLREVFLSARFSGLGIPRRSGGRAMKRFALLMTLSLGSAGPVLALQQPSPGQRDARVP